MNKFCRFEMEQQLLDCWNVTKDLNTVYEELTDHGLKHDNLQNVLMGMQELYNLKFEKLWRTFEEGIRNGKIR